MLLCTPLLLTACEKEEAEEIPEMAAPEPCTPSCGTGEEGHSCCREAYGPRYFCNLSGLCVQAAACTEPRCCLPSAGVNGDQRCVELMGLGSQCEIMGDKGHCSDGACRGCALDNEGHGCCQDMLGATAPDSVFICDLITVDPEAVGPLPSREGQDAVDNDAGQALADETGEDGADFLEGRCLGITPCDHDAQPRCCVPGPMGEAYCKDAANDFGQNSYCAASGGGESKLGQCAQVSQPIGDGCTPDAAGDALCQESGDDFFCNFNGQCRRFRDCLADDCCLPNELGNQRCAEQMGEGSLCEALRAEERGRCTAVGTD